MTDNLYSKKYQYHSILNRLQKQISINEGLFIIKKLYLTNNIFYYFLCVLLRFIPLIAVSGDYSNFLFNKRKSKSFQSYLKFVNLYNLLKELNISFVTYCLISFVICLVIIIRIIIDFYNLKKIKSYKNEYKWPFPSKFQIIIDHVIFLLFPYIIEFLSFSYYLFFFSNKFLLLN